MSRQHVVILVAIEVFPCADEFGVIWGEPHRQRKRFDCFERQRVVFVVRFFAFAYVPERMSMIIDCFDLIDFGEKLWIGWCLRLDVYSGNTEGCYEYGESLGQV